MSKLTQPCHPAQDSTAQAPTQLAHAGRLFYGAVQPKSGLCRPVVWLVHIRHMCGLLLPLVLCCRFVCRTRLGGRKGEPAAYLTPVPPNAVVYGSGDAARVISKVREVFCSRG